MSLWPVHFIGRACCRKVLQSSSGGDTDVPISVFSTQILRHGVGMAIYEENK